MTKKRLVVGAVAVALLTLAGGGGAAQASSVEYFNGGVSRTISTYSPTLHRLSVYDSASDGWGNFSNYAFEIGGGTGTVTNTGGWKSTASKTFIPLGGHVYYNACAKNGATTIGCTTAISDLA